MGGQRYPADKLLYFSEYLSVAQWFIQLGPGPHLTLGNEFFTPDERGQLLTQVDQPTQNDDLENAYL